MVEPMGMSPCLTRSMQFENSGNLGTCAENTHVQINFVATHSMQQHLYNQIVLVFGFHHNANLSSLSLNSSGRCLVNIYSSKSWNKQMGLWPDKMNVIL